MTQPTGSTNQPTTPPGRPVAPGRTEAVGWAFYAVVLAVALTGASTSAAHWLHWFLPFAVAAVGAVELGGVYLSVHAAERRRLGERAVAARILSAAVAGGAVAINYFGHAHKFGQALFFAGMSALGYTVWLIHSGARRRDALRAAGKLADVAPVYPLTQWLRHPWLTRRARALAVADPTLGLHESLRLATEAWRAERRQAAIATVLRRKIEASADPVVAEIAVTVFDLDRIAHRLARGADYDALTNLLAVDLDPTRLLADRSPVEPVGRPQPGAEVTGQPQSTGRAADRRPAPLQVVGEPAAVANARHLRSIYPGGLPDTERAIRNRTGWSKVRVEKAVEAYRSGADRAQCDAAESDDDQERHQPAYAEAN